MVMLRALGLALLAATLGLGAQARTLTVGTGQQYKLPSEAIAAAKPGDTVAIQPDEYFDCAVVKTDRLVIAGVGDGSKVIITDKACGGKGLLVTTGTGIVVRNLTLTRARVADGNGAGIRNEGADLTVEGVRFVNNQNGILSTPQELGTVIVKDSLFERNGGCGSRSGCAHGIYVAQGKSLKVENSTFVGTKQGHHIKSRAAMTEVLGSTISDGQDGTASYLIEIPIGGGLVVRGNTMEKGPMAENHSAAIVIGAEGVSQRTPEIIVENNNFRNDGGWSTYFLNNLTATEAEVRNNHFGGRVVPLNGDGTVTPRP